MYTISDTFATLGGIRSTLGAIAGTVGVYTLILYVIELARVTKRKAKNELVKLQISSIAKKVPLHIKEIEILLKNEHVENSIQLNFDLEFCKRVMNREEKIPLDFKGT